MNQPQDQIPGMKELVSLHNQIAGQLKEYEQCMSETAPLEVLNELRYALRAIMERLTCEEQKAPELMQRARHALLCAYHDLLDGVLIELNALMDKTYQEYPDATYAVLGNKRLDMLEYIFSIEDKVKYTRSHPEQRHEIYDQLYDDFPVLIDHLKSFKRVYLPEIIAMSDRMAEREAAMAKQEAAMVKREKVARRYTLIGLGLTAVAVLFTILRYIGD